MGTPRGHELKDPIGWSVALDTHRLTLLAEMDLLSDVVNDLDLDFSANHAAAESHKNDQRNTRKIREATENLKINLIHPLRVGKRILVLDIDYSQYFICSGAR